MRTIENQNKANEISHYYENIVSQDLKKTTRHFNEQGISTKTIHRTINRFKETGSSSYKKSPGRPAKIMTYNVIQSVKSDYEKDPTISERNMAKKHNLTKTTIHNIKKKKLKMKTYKKETTPKYTEDQKRRIEENLRKLVEKRLPSTSSKIIVMDNETYCMHDPNDNENQS